MIKKSTWLILIILLLVVGGYLFMEKKPATIEAINPTATESMFILVDESGILTRLSIQGPTIDQFEMHRDTNQQWEIGSPFLGQADQGLAGAAETQARALRIISTIEIPLALKDYGLSDPVYRITFEFSGGATYLLGIGYLTPTGSGYYARLDDGSVMVISQAGVESLLNLSTAPPYIATSIPTITADISLVPGPGTPTP